MRSRLVFEYTDLPFPISLHQTGKDRFIVRYGLQEDIGEYGYAAKKLGEALMHALNCEGRILP